MFVRAYLRASTTDQDASRARDSLVQFAAEHGATIASYYTENESGTKLARPELFRLLDDCHPGDALLVEQVDRLSRLNHEDWQTLRAIIKAKRINVVALDLPTSHRLISSFEATDDFTGRMLAAVNEMLLDMLAAVARKDYEDRKRRTEEGRAKAKADGKYKGRPINNEQHKKIKELLSDGKSIRKVAELLSCSTQTVQRAKKSTEENTTNCSI
ncbi:MAG: serine recombinase [Pseudomonas sp. PGPPP3]|nr:MAG: serine recombinase [Pseudomonas sp. PGPPP3]